MPSGDELQRPRASELLGPVLPVVALLAAMWAVEVVDIPLDGDLDRFGIRPRERDGLSGIVAAPLLHDGFGHLLTNTLPFLVLGGIIVAGSATRFVQVTVVVWLTSGIGTWLTGPERSVHVGASGLVFGYLAYLVSRGFFARRIGYLLVGAVVFLLYGSALWGLLPRPGISWQGHLFGAVGGVLAAWLVHAERTEVR